MDAVFADRGGDPDRVGKRGRFDPLLWRAERDGEPAWDDDVLGAGRPGWHIECTAISLDHLGHPFDVQGGGSDLVFPHHEMSAVQSTALTGDDAFARHYVHQAMVGLRGREDEQVQGQPRARVEAARRRGRPDGDPAASCSPGTTAPTGTTRPTSSTPRPRASTAGARRSRSTRAPMPTSTRRRGAGRRRRRPRHAAARSPAVDAWADRTLAGEWDDAAAPGLVSRTVDAVLGIRL